MVKRILLTLSLIASLVIIAPPAQASFKDGYFRNDNINPPVSVGIQTYPHYAGYKILLSPGQTYSNYDPQDTWPETGDLTGVTVGAGWECLVDQYSSRTGGMISRILVKGPKFQSLSYVSPQNLITIWACHT